MIEKRIKEKEKKKIFTYIQNITKINLNQNKYREIQNNNNNNQQTN